MVLVFTAVAFLVTWIFNANVDAQGGAYATGVLVLITSAAVASHPRRPPAGQRGWTIGFAVISVVFLYTTVANVVERPDGVKIGACFIAAIVLVSFVSRLLPGLRAARHAGRPRRAGGAVRRDAPAGKIRLVANEPDAATRPSTARSCSRSEPTTTSPPTPTCSSSRSPSGTRPTSRPRLDVHGELVHGRYRVLTLESATVPNALAALLLHVRDRTGARPHIYFEWTEGNPAAHLLRFLLFGQGEVAPVTREVLREAEPDRSRRPHVHVG